METYKLIGQTKVAADLLLYFWKDTHLSRLIGDRICVTNSHWDELLKSVLNLNYSSPAVVWNRIKQFLPQWYNDMKKNLVLSLLKAVSLHEKAVT